MSQIKGGEMKLFFLSVAAGKRLIGMGIATHPRVKQVLDKGTLVVVAGTTNAYVVEEIFRNLDIQGFSPEGFFRGVTVPSQLSLSGSREFPGDVVLTDGEWLKGKTLFDVVDHLGEGDLILKGANALDVENREAAVLIGHDKAGTMGAIMGAVAGRRVGLLMPVGLEKRVNNGLLSIATEVNRSGSYGLRLFPATGEAFTELDAIKLLTGASAELIAAGGVGGSEGGVWLGVSGTESQMSRAEELLRVVSAEPPFAV